MKRPLDTIYNLHWRQLRHWSVTVTRCRACLIRLTQKQCWRWVWRWITMVPDIFVMTYHLVMSHLCHHTTILSIVTPLVDQCPLIVMTPSQQSQVWCLLPTPGKYSYCKNKQLWTPGYAPDMSVSRFHVASLPPNRQLNSVWGCVLFRGF